MGCDIHPYIDFEVEHTPPGSKPYISVRNYAELYGNRDYLLFGLLTGGQVRVPDAYIPEVGTPLGLPGRVSWKTLDEAALYIVPDDQEREEEGMAFESDALRWVNSGYSNWINYDFRESTINYTIPAQREGVATIPKNARVTDPDWHSHSYVNPDQLAAVLKAYGRIGKKVWGGKVDDYSPDPEVYGWLGAMRALAKRPGVKNVRLVYWFDN